MLCNTHQSLLWDVRLTATLGASCIFSAVDQHALHVMGAKLQLASNPPKAAIKANACTKVPRTQAGSIPSRPRAVNEGGTRLVRAFCLEVHSFGCCTARAAICLLPVHLCRFVCCFNARPGLQQNRRQIALQSRRRLSFFAEVELFTTQPRSDAVCALPPRNSGGWGGGGGGVQQLEDNREYGGGEGVQSVGRALRAAHTVS